MQLSKETENILVNRKLRYGRLNDPDVSYNTLVANDKYHGLFSSVDYLEYLNKILNDDSEKAKNKIEDITKFYSEHQEMAHQPYLFGGSVRKDKEVYQFRVAEAICTQLGHTSKNIFFQDKEAFLSCSDETIQLLAKGLRDEYIIPLLLGKEGETTLLRNNASCEDKIDFLLRLRKIGIKAFLNLQIDKLINGQLQYIKDHYKEDTEIGGMKKDEYIQSIRNQLGDPYG